MPKKSTDSLDDTISKLEQNQAKMNSKLVRLKLRCSTSVSSASALKHSKKDSFDLSKLVPSDAI